MSEYYIKKEIEHAFEDVLGRAPEEAALNFYSEKWFSYEQMCDKLKSSPEYKKKMGVKEKVPERRGWPLPQLFVATNIKVLYCPIAKNACSTLKRLMVDVSDIPEKKELLARGDIHKKTDSSFTGIQLKDLSEEYAEKALYDKAYFRFAVLRNPFDRILSAYWEKFVVNRKNKGNISHTLPVINQIRQKDLDDSLVEKGVTFREFVSFLVNSNPDSLDPHWCPQSNYLKCVEYDSYFDVKNLAPLYKILSDRVGRKIEPEAKNVSGSGGGQFLKGAMDKLPEELITFGLISKDSFYDYKISRNIKAFYEEDFSFLEKCEA
ncbi:sulfotransferase family 2 domain-containing protein [Salinisphaera orenii]|uniref:sulfotransferase family 2 domain-containing protein n=1 Tax=Salinisphaera orenii TaxID=856731 RepID=UPI0013A66CFE